MARHRKDHIQLPKDDPGIEESTHISFVQKGCDTMDGNINYRFAWGYRIFIDYYVHLFTISQRWLENRLGTYLTHNHY